MIYLSLPLEELVERAARRPRPALTDLTPADEVASLLAQRDPLYRKAADITVLAGVGNPILTLLESWPRTRSEA